MYENDLADYKMNYDLLEGFTAERGIITSNLLDISFDISDVNITSMKEESLLNVEYAKKTIMMLIGRYPMEVRSFLMDQLSRPAHLKSLRLQ